jgi:glycogen synthase
VRVLFLSAYYPPFEIGGWEQLVQEINERLKFRGHITHVLTSNYGVPEDFRREKDVNRVLTLENDPFHYKPSAFFWGRKGRLRQNLAHTQKTIELFKPDVVFVHVMWNLSQRIPYLAEQLCPGRVVYYLADNWPYAPDVHQLFWRDPAKNLLLRGPKMLLGLAVVRSLQQENRENSLRFERVLCVSQAIKQELALHVPEDSRQFFVVYNGIDLNSFKFKMRKMEENRNGRKLSLLYAGSLVEHKGVQTAILAVDKLSSNYEPGKLSLTIVGAGNQDYETFLRGLVKSKHLEEYVTFRGRVPRDEMPALLLEFDVLIFPSTWEEPLARVMQEAMAIGLVVIGTTTGGSKELLVEGETGLTFLPEDFDGLAVRIEQLLEDPNLGERFVLTARQKIERQFNILRMVDEIEYHFSELVLM